MKFIRNFAVSSSENGIVSRHFLSLKWQFSLQSMRYFLQRAFEWPSPAKISGRATVAPVKNDDFGGVSPPLEGKRFCVTENISRNGKHSLLCPEHTMFRDSKTGRISRPVPACSPANLKRRTARSRSRHREQNRSKKEGPQGVLFKKAD